MPVGAGQGQSNCFVVCQSCVRHLPLVLSPDTSCGGGSREPLEGLQSKEERAQGQFVPSSLLVSPGEQSPRRRCRSAPWEGSRLRAQSSCLADFYRAHSMSDAGEILKRKAVPFRKSSGYSWGDLTHSKSLKGDLEEKSLKGQPIPSAPLPRLPLRVSSLPTQLGTSSLPPAPPALFFILHFLQNAFLDQTHLYLVLLAFKG